MNTANVMAISPKPGTPNKIQPARTASKAGGDTVSQEKDSFGEVLGKAGEDVTGKVPQSPAKAQQGSDKAETGADKNNVNAEAKSVNDIAADVKENFSEEIPETVKNMAGQAALLNFTTEGKNQLVAEIEPEAAAKVDLQSLIPQSAETMQKNKTFLAMLSGQQITPVAANNTNEQALNVDSLQTQLWGQAQNKQPVTVLEAQLNNHQLANQQGEQMPPVSAEIQQPLVNGKDTLLNAKGMALPEQSEQTMTSIPVGGVNKSAELQDIAPAIMAPPVKNEEGQANSNPLAGVNVVVEEEVPVVMPGMEARQFTGQQNDQRQQPAVPQQEVISTDGENVTQLAEEAAGDKAPVRPTQSAPAQQAAGNEPVSMFQQSLNDSIRGIDQSSDVQQTSAPQDDFNVPRQIIDQARLLRRGADTQMVIKLNPEHLGELTLKVTVSANGAVNASFHSDNAQVRAIIENTLVQLKQELNNQGLKVDNVDVYAGLSDGQLPQGEGQQAWQQNQGQHGTGTGNVASIGGVEEYGEDTAVTAAAAAESQVAAEGVDYRI
ncbi:flagellar hook-length control protein FliK [Selenomonas sp. AE3005]|uniref:flagellar hook-length control protein FliK n=1 Tax=Selenomonas sp. AE3005 TaxID=1485543 RepID=UPI0025DDDAC9|nr:flagellar hook-length control protein FliK [Selenomonas sp. AE3005]